MERKNALMVFVMYSILTLGVFTPFITFEQAFASDVLWGIDRDSATISHLSPFDGSVISSATIPCFLTPNAPCDIVEKATGLAADPTTGTFYALLKVEHFDTRVLVTIVPSTGIATFVGDTGDKFAGIAFLADGTLRSVTGDQDTNPPANAESYYTLSKTTGLPTLVCALGNGNAGEEIAFNPSDGFVWHASGWIGGGDDRILETIDDNVCNVTDVPLSGTLHAEATGMTYSTAEGLFLVSDINANFFSITDTGVETQRGFYSFVSGDPVYGGLAFNVHDDVAIGGTYIPIDQSALLLAGISSVSMWMIPVVIAGIGIGVFVIKRRN